MEMIRRKDVQVGMLVEIECENNIIRGYITDIHTKTNNAKQVIVKIKTGEVGKVVHLVTREEMEMERFKYYNRFFYEQTILSIWDKKINKYYILEETQPKTNKTRHYAYLFTDERVAKSVLSSLKDDRYMLRRLNRKKRIGENFKTLHLTHYRINEERRITVKNLGEREQDYLNLAPNRSRKGKR